jgi:NADPH:quinone reductase-like Zn-dependent oxidoreductase
VAGTSAYAAVRAVDASPGDVVVVSGAAGGVGSLAVQLARRAGATVIGLAGPANHPWLTEHGVVVAVVVVDRDDAGLDELAERVRTAAGGKVTAFIDTFGADYVDLALRLGVSPDRIDTIINFAAAERHGVKTDGNAAANTSAVVAELARLVNDGHLEVPIARTYPLDQVREAYRELERRHTRGKIVLIP